MASIKFFEKHFGSHFSFPTKWAWCFTYITWNTNHVLKPHFHWSHPKVNGSEGQPPKTHWTNDQPAVEHTGWKMQGNDVMCSCGSRVCCFLLLATVTLKSVLSRATTPCTTLVREPFHNHCLFFRTFSGCEFILCVVRNRDSQSSCKLFFTKKM